MVRGGGRYADGRGCGGRKCAGGGCVIGRQMGVGDRGAKDFGKEFGKIGSL